MSLVPELPHVTETAATLAELFPDASSLGAETRDKLHRILLKWEDSVLTDDKAEDVGDTGSGTPSGRTLAKVYHSKIRDHEQQRARKLRASGVYHEQVFPAGDVETGHLLIGSRPFETCSDFLVCLDTFYSVTFGSCMESQGSNLPLTDAFSTEVRRAQLELVPAEVTQRSEFTRSIDVRRSPRIKSTAAKKSSAVEITSNKRRLFHHGRSVSETELTSGRKSPAATLRKALSQSVEMDVSASKSGPDITDSTRLRGTGTTVPKTKNCSANGLRLGLEPFTKATRMTDLCSGDSVSNSNLTKSVSVDYLSESVLPPRTAKRLKFDGQMAEVERLAEWLNGWAMRHRDAGSSSSAIRLRVSPQLLAYGLWLIDSCRFFTPRVDDITVAVVRGGQMPSSVPQEPSSSRVSAHSSSAGAENGDRPSAQPGRSADGGQEVPGNYAGVGRKGRAEQTTVCHDESSDEVTDEVNRWSRSREQQAASTHQEFSKPGNRLENNNTDRSDLLYCEPL